MSNVFTLDALREETKKRFAPVEIGLSDGTKITLVPSLRLPADDRKVVKAALDDIQEIDNDDTSQEACELLIESISKIFNVVADKPAKLLRELHDDDYLVKVMLMSRVLQEWAGQTQLGEA